MPYRTDRGKPQRPSCLGVYDSKAPLVVSKKNQATLRKNTAHEFAGRRAYSQRFCPCADDRQTVLCPGSLATHGSAYVKICHAHTNSPDGVDRNLLERHNIDRPVGVVGSCISGRSFHAGQLYALRCWRRAANLGSIRGSRSTRSVSGRRSAREASCIRSRHKKPSCCLHEQDVFCRESPCPKHGSLAARANVKV